MLKVLKHGLRIPLFYILFVFHSPFIGCKKMKPNTFTFEVMFPRVVSSPLRVPFLLFLLSYSVEHRKYRLYFIGYFADEQKQLVRGVQLCKTIGRFELDSPLFSSPCCDIKWRLLENGKSNPLCLSSFHSYLFPL